MGRATRRHVERHTASRSGWLRAAVLGSGDAVISTASLMMGFAASQAPTTTILLAGIAGLVAGALSMAAGEFVSVSSQKDAEQADIAREKQELEVQPDAELSELAALYERQGLERALALEVARQLTAKDALKAHMHAELGLDQLTLARPLQAAWVSAASFATFALVPVVALLLSPRGFELFGIASGSLTSLAVTGAIGARLGGAPVLRAALRVTCGGALAMALTAAVGRLFGVSVG
jgi:vacuolar iron transporter family protein